MMHSLLLKLSNTSSFLLCLTVQTELILVRFSPAVVKHSGMFYGGKTRRLSSSDPLVFNSICKQPTVENTAGSTISLNNPLCNSSILVEDGLRKLLRQRTLTERLGF